MMRKKPPYAASRQYNSVHDYEVSGVGVYPEEIPVYLSHAIFPYDASTLNDADVPLGCVAKPFILHANWCKQSDPTLNMPKASDVARCDQCGAYVNPFCDLNSSRWFCSLCGSHNKIQKHQLRYRQGDSRTLQELNDLVSEFSMPLTSDGKVFSLPAEKRPFVHVFLVQENMQLDNLQATIDALVASVDGLHPDMHVVLLTYSNRVGMYSLLPLANAFVQYVNFEQMNDAEHGESFILGRRSLLAPLGEMCSFWNVQQPLSSCSDSLREALRGIFDNPSCKDDEIYQTVDICSILEVLYQWIADSTSSKTQKHNRKSSEDAFDWSKLWHVFNNAEGLHAYFKPDDVKECCSGVMVHAFSDRPMHVPIPTYFNGLLINSERTVEHLAQRFSDINVCINIWGIASFESNTLHLSLPLPLVQKTGGQLHRISLGIDRDLSMVNYTEELSRSLNTRYATNCMVKVRSCPVLNIECIGHQSNKGDDIVTIPAMTPHSSLGFEMSFQNKEYGSLLEVDVDSRRKERRNAVQLAFSFETLVESKLENEESNVIDEEISINHSDYIMKAMERLGIAEEGIDREMIKEILSEPPYGSTVQKGRRRNTELHRSQGHSTYNKHSKLIVVKVLRIITLAQECTHKLTNFLQGSNYNVIASIMMRRVLDREMCRERRSTEEGGRNRVVEGSIIANIIVNKDLFSLEREIVNLIARVQINLYQLKYSSKDSKEGRDESKEQRKVLLRDILSSSPTNELVYYLSSTILRCLQYSLQEDLDNRLVYQNSDKASLFYFYLLYYSPSITLPLLQPLLLGIEGRDWGGELGKVVALERESMVSSGYTSFLLDGGEEMIVYRNKIGSREKIREDEDKVEGEENKESSFVKMIRTRNAYMKSIVGHVIRRVSHSPLMAVPLIAEAGTGTASYLAPHLLLDESLTPVSYNTLLDAVLDIVVDALSSQLL